MSSIVQVIGTEGNLLAQLDLALQGITGADDI
jgi:hypothetical protein